MSPSSVTPPSDTATEQQDHMLEPLRARLLLGGLKSLFLSMQDAIDETEQEGSVTQALVDGLLDTREAIQMVLNQLAHVQNISKGSRACCEHALCTTEGCEGDCEDCHEDACQEDCEDCDSCEGCEPCEEEEDEEDEEAEFVSEPVKAKKPAKKPVKAKQKKAPKPVKQAGKKPTGFSSSRPGVASNVIRG